MYSTVTSACQGSGLACTLKVTIFRTLTYMQKRFRHQNKPLYREWNNYSKSIASRLVHLLIPRFIPNDGGWGICLRMSKPVKAVTLKILNNVRVYITLVFFSDERVIMESQCIYVDYGWKGIICMLEVYVCLMFLNECNLPMTSGLTFIVCIMNVWVFFQGGVYNYAFI